MALRISDAHFENPVMQQDLLCKICQKSDLFGILVPLVWHEIMRCSYQYFNFTELMSVHSSSLSQQNL